MTKQETINYLKKNLLITFCLLQVFCAEGANIDSLVSLLKTASDEKRVDVLNDLAWEYTFNEPRMAMRYSNQALALAKLTNYAKGEAKAYSNIGVVHDVTGTFDSALFYYSKSLETSIKLNNHEGIGSAHSNLGLTYWNIGNYEKAFENYSQALREFKQVDNTKYLGHTYNNLGLLYSDLGDVKKALEHHMLAKTFLEKSNNARGVAACFTNIGNAYESLGYKDSALYYYNKSLVLKRKLNDEYGIAITLNDIGLMYAKMNNNTKALEYLKEGLDYKILLGDKWGTASTLIALSEVYQKLGDETKFYSCITEAERLATSIKNYKLLAIAYGSLSDYYNEKKDLVNAYGYLKKQQAANDSLYKKDRAEKLLELQTRYETEQKENQIKLLLQEKEISKLEAQTQKNIRNQAIVAAIGVIVILVLLYNRFKLKQKQLRNAELLDQKQLRLNAIITTQEQERKRIAEELHDGIGQMLSAVKLNVAALEGSLENNSTQHQYQTALRLIDDSCKEVRGISHNMMPAILTKAGLDAAVHEFAYSISGSGRIKIHTDVHILYRQEPFTEVNIYRIVQELITNIIKYAMASEIHIQINQDKKELSIMIEDNGKGFNKSQLIYSKGNGWYNINSRLSVIKGSIEIDSKPGKGTVVSIVIPNNNISA